MRLKRPGRFSLIADGRILAAVAVMLVLLLGAVFRLVARAPGSARARVGLARAYLDQMRLKEAESLLIEVLKEDPQEHTAYDVLGSVYYRMNRKGDAEAAWRNGMSIEGRFAGFYVNLGALEAEKGDLEEALFFFREAARRNAASPDPYKNAARACYNAGRYREALAYWEKARQLGMRDDPVLSGMMEKARRQLAVTDT